MTREEAIKKIKKSWDFLGNDEKEILETLVPELAESEDEKIRKALLEYFGEECDTATINGIYCYKIYDWLEKQGESDETKAKMFLMNKGYPIDTNGIFPTYEEMYNIIRDGLENQVEQKLADKVESIFNVGEWVTNGSDCTFQIASIENGMYYDTNNCGSDIENIDKYYYLWTINDAKEGDVLATDKSVFIYAKVLYNKPYAYCGVDKFGVFKDNCLKNNWANSVDNIHPATKEQRDTLFAAMKAEGYEWDAEKKELKKRGVIE